MLKMMKNILVIGIMFSFMGSVFAHPNKEGCTPGFWKQPHHFDSWVTYSPIDTLCSVFTETCGFSFGGDTLLEALKYHGGPDPEDQIKNMLKHAVAALLNAASGDVNYPLSVKAVKDKVNDLIVNGDLFWIEFLKDKFDDLNNRDCPLR